MLTQAQTSTAAKKETPKEELKRAIEEAVTKPVIVKLRRESPKKEAVEAIMNVVAPGVKSEGLPATLAVTPVTPVTAKKNELGPNPIA